MICKNQNDVKIVCQKIFKLYNQVSKKVIEKFDLVEILQLRKKIDVSIGFLPDISRTQHLNNGGTF